MAAFLAAVAGPSRLLTCFGDDDGGRLFHPYGPRDRFPRATLATCAALFPEEPFPFNPEDLAAQAAWLLGVTGGAPVPAKAETRYFPDSGLAAIAHEDLHVLIDAGPFGAGGAGHSHADTLSLTVRAGDREILIDPATFTYVGNAKLRNAFRGTAFHNTIRIDGRDQADPAAPFRWERKPEVRSRDWVSRPGLAFLDAECSYRELTHRRRVLVFGREVILVLDEVSGPEGEHSVEQFWHTGSDAVPMLFSDPGAVSREQGLRSRVFGEKEPATVFRACWKTKLPHTCAAAVLLNASGTQLLLQGHRLSIPGLISVSFASPGFPEITRT